MDVCLTTGVNEVQELSPPPPRPRHPPATGTAAGRGRSRTLLWAGVCRPPPPAHPGQQWVRGSSRGKGSATGTGARTTISVSVSPPERLPALLPPRRLCCPALLWEISGNDPSPDGTSAPPTLITVTAKHFVSIIWPAASRLPAAPEHPQAQPRAPAAARSSALRLPAAPDASRRGGSRRPPRGCATGRAGPGCSHRRDAGRRVRGHVVAGGRGTPFSQHPGALRHPGEGWRGRRGGYQAPGARTPAGAEPVAVCVSVRVRVSAHVCPCACVCLCAQPGKVTVRERRQQPRNGFGMESVSQVEPQERPEPSCSSLAVVTVSICAVGGAGPAAPGPPRVPLLGGSGRAGGQGCLGEPCGRGALGSGTARGKGESSWRKGRVLPLSVCCVRFGGGTMSPFTRCRPSPPQGRPRSSLLLLLSCRVVETSTLQQERLQAIAVSPPRAVSPRRARRTFTWRPHVPPPSPAARGADAGGKEGCGRRGCASAGAVPAQGLCSRFPSPCPGAAGGGRSQRPPCVPSLGRGSLPAKQGPVGAGARVSCPAAALPRDAPRPARRIPQGSAETGTERATGGWEV